MKEALRQLQNAIAVRGVLSDSDRHAANDLMAKAQLPSYRDSMEWLEGVGPDWPGFRREFTRMAFVNGELAGAMRMLPVTLRIGRARLKAGGIGWVSTSPDYRNRGVCAALMRDSLSLMQKHRFPLSLLYGIPNLYHRYGYITAIPEHSVVVECSAVALEGKPRFKMRSVTTKDIPALRRMHDQHETEVSCSLVRSTALYHSQFANHMPKTPYWCDWSMAKMVVDRNGSLIAYLMPQISGGELHIKELGIKDRASCGPLLHAAAVMAGKAGLNRMRFHVPPYHPFAHHLEELDSIHETRHFENREGMIALIDLGECLKRMLPEWNERLKNAGACTHATECTLVVDGMGHRISSDGNQLTLHPELGKNRLPVTAQEFVRLLTGYAHLEDTLELKAPRVRDEAKRLLRILFPKRTPFIWPIDHF